MEDTSSSLQAGGDAEISETDASSVVPDVIPLEDYNIKKAKLKASLKWMVAKAYTKYDAPLDLKDPFFRDAEGEDHLKPSVIYQLASSELYSMACNNVFPPTLHQWQGHWSIIQGLSRKGIYVVDDKEQPVTETVLAQTQRIKLSAHLAMMDSIQRAYVGEVASIEKIVQAVRQISTFSASSELPDGVEDALLFWMNKVCGTVRHQMEKDIKSQQENLIQSSPQKVRLRREQLQAKELPSIPVMDDIMKDLGDGCCLAVLLHFYCPHLMPLDDLTLQDPMSFAESIHNLNIIEEFFKQHLPKLYPFKPEDLLYSPACLKSNVLALLGELFYTCEVSKPEHLGIGQENVPKASTKPDGLGSKLPPLPISSATKKSFHNDVACERVKNELRTAASNPELNKIESSDQMGQQPLLNRRQRQAQRSFRLGNGDDSLQSQLRRTTSLDNMNVGKRSFVAWENPEDRQDGYVNSVPLTSSEPERSSVKDSQTSSLLTNVSLDSELGESMNLDELNVAESQNGLLHSNQEVPAPESRPGTYSMPEYVDEDDLEVESLTSALSRVSRVSENVQPSHVKSMDGPPAVAGADLNGLQISQFNGSKGAYEQRHQSEHVRTDSAVQSETASYASDHQSSLGYTLGGTGSEQLDSSSNRKKLTLDIQPVPTGLGRGRLQEKLMPAVVRPLKEKSHNANKQEERGVLSQGRSPRQNADTNSKFTSWGNGGKHENNDLSPDLEATTPLSPESIADSLASDFALRNKDNIQKGQYQRVPFQPLNQNISQEPQMSKGKHGEAFYIHADHNAPLQDGMRDSVEDTRPYPTSSFTIVDKQHTMESAQQAGIPVVTSVEDMQRSLQRSHRTMDAVHGRGSPRIMHSNAYSDSYPHPHANPPPNTQPSPHHMPMHSPHMHSYSPSHSHTPPPLHTPSPLHTPPPPPPPSHVNPNYPNLHYPNPHHSNPLHPHPHHPHPHHPSPHRGSPHYPAQHVSPQPTLHGHLPGNPQYTGPVGGGGVGGGRVELTRFGNPGHGAPHQDNREPLAVGLAQARLKLEEKRRSMEKEKRTLERHWTKQRQRVGKAAFLQVLANQKRAKEPETVSNTSPDSTLGRGGNREYSKEEIERSLQEAQARWLHEQNNQPGKTTFAALSANKDKSSAQKGGISHGRDLESPQVRSDSPFSTTDGGKQSPGSSSGSHSPPHMTQEQYNTSLDKMNENMSQLMREIQKLSVQQEQLKTAMESPRQQAAMESPRQQAAMESPRQQATKQSPRQQASQPSDGSHRQPTPSESQHSGFVLHGNATSTPIQAPGQPFFLGKQTPSPPGPPSTEPDNEPFMLQENPLFEMSEQMSPPTGRPVGFVAQSPRGQVSGSPRDNFSTYVVQKPKSRPKLNFDQGTDKTATESLASKRGQQITPVETGNIAKSAGSDAPMTLDDLDRSPPSQGFRLHDTNTDENDAQVVQASTYRAPVGFEIVDDSKPTPKKNSKERQSSQQTPRQTHRQTPRQTLQQKPQQTSQQTPKQQPEKTPRLRRTPSGSPTKKRPPSVYEIVGETEELGEPIEPMVVRPLDESGQEVDDSGESKVLGFVIAQEKTEEDEIAKRREQFLRSRLKKQEEEKAKKAAREAQAEKLKEEHRRKQDEIEAKKAREIERREKIRLAYQKRKQQEQDEQDGPPVRERKPTKTKSRPRSRVIDDHTDYAKPTISSGPPAVSAQDVAEANMPIRQQKSSFTISSSNGQSDRNGGGASSVSSGHSTPTQPSKSAPSSTPAAGVTSSKASSPEKPPSVPDAVKRRPPSPRVRSKQTGSKHTEPSSSQTKRDPSQGASGPPSERSGSGKSDDDHSASPSVVSQDSNESGGSTAPEYTGPKLYVKPASKSNRHIITNAIAHCVLAGTVNQGSKDKVLQEVAKSDYKHFVILFRNTGLQFRGLYGYSPDSDEITKIYGTGPRHVTPKMIEGLYKYNSGDKSFSKIPSKTMSVQIDGITIANHLWQSKKPSTGKKH